MPPVALGMILMGCAALAVGLSLARHRVAAEAGAGKLLALGPVFEATALAIFAAEHFLDAHDLASIVPRWLGAPMFWTYFFGAALLAAAVSFIAWRSVRLSALLLASFFLLIVATLDVPAVPKEFKQRLFWSLTVRETCFASGAIILAGSVWKHARSGVRRLMGVARWFVAGVFVFYAIEHFLFPLFTPGVPDAKLSPSWIPAPVLISWLVGLTLLVTGPGLLLPRTRRAAAAVAGAVLMLLTIFFYIPILVSEIHTPLALEGMNFVGDTMLFAATALLAGRDSPEEGLPD